MTSIFRIAAGVVLLASGPSGCAEQRGPLPSCRDVVRHIPHSALTIQDVNKYEDYRPNFPKGIHLFDVSCLPAFGHLPDGETVTVHIFLTRLTVPSLKGEPRASVLGTTMTGQLNNNLCMSGKTDFRGDPPIAAHCYNPTMPIVGRGRIQGDLAIVVGVGGASIRDDYRARRLLENAADQVLETVIKR